MPGPDHEPSDEHSYHEHGPDSPACNRPRKSDHSNSFSRLPSALCVGLHVHRRPAAASGVRRRRVAPASNRRSVERSARAVAVGTWAVLWLIMRIGDGYVQRSGNVRAPITVARGGVAALATCAGGLAVGLFAWQRCYHQADITKMWGQIFMVGLGLIAAASFTFARPTRGYLLALLPGVAIAVAGYLWLVGNTTATRCTWYHERAQTTPSTTTAGPVDEPFVGSTTGPPAPSPTPTTPQPPSSP
jgi:hypothetical protein